MPVSRLRLRLGLGFALAFAVGLAILTAGSMGYLWRESHRRLDHRLDALITDVETNLTAEFQSSPDADAAENAREVVGEWPRNGGSFVITDERSRVLAHTDSAETIARVLRDWKPTDHVRFDVAAGDDQSYRASAVRFALTPGDSARPAQTFQIVAFSSTAGISEDAELLLTANGIAAPIILLLSLFGGYLMAGRAMRPVTELTASVASIAPDDLSRRLPVPEPHDELGKLAIEFNAMLARLNSAQTRNRRFVREAAHQIRTPLTLVLGEASLELSIPDGSAERMRESLRRIGSAAERMRRRVDELFLLAEAQSGERVLLTESVAVDQVMYRAVELMRPRAVALGRILLVGTADAVSTKGNSELLHEALLEMIENALRHGDTSRNVTVSVTADNERVTLVVDSGGVPFALPPRTESDGPDGLGLPIVRWVAETHGGELLLVNHQGCNSLRLVLPTNG